MISLQTYDDGFILLLCRENLFEELLQEQDALILKRKRNQELLRVLEQSVQVVLLFWTVDCFFIFSLV